MGQFSWFDVLQLGAVAAVLTQLLGFGFERLSRHFSNKQDARILALLIAVSLEKFALECSNVVASNDLFRSSGGHAGRQVEAIPEFPDLMATANWKVLDANLAARAATMPNERMLGEGQIDFWWEVTGERDNVVGATDNECGRCGYFAWEIARDLRTKYGLPQISVRGLSWDFVGLLRKNHDRAMKLISERAETHSEDA